MKFIKAMLLFVVGAGTGFAVGYLLSKKKYEKKADTEIESVKRAFNKHLEEVKSQEDLITLLKADQNDSSKLNESSMYYIIENDDEIQIVQIIGVVQGVIGTYLLGQKATEKKGV